MSGVGEWNMLLGEIIYAALLSHGFIASPEGMQQ